MRLRAHALSELQIIKVFLHHGLEVSSIDHSLASLNWLKGTMQAETSILIRLQGIRTLHLSLTALITHHDLLSWLLVRHAILNMLLAISPQVGSSTRYETLHLGNYILEVCLVNFLEVTYLSI